MTATAVEILTGWLLPTDSVLEWGSGRSTLWFAQRVQRLISVEHDRDWYTTVGKQLSEAQGIHAAVERHLIPGGESADDGAGLEYSHITDHIGDTSLDLVLVDGIQRDICAAAALPKLRPGGILVLDNADWYFQTGTRTPAAKRNKLWSPTWAQFQKAVSGWRRLVTSNGVWDTVFWIRPAGQVAGRHTPLLIDEGPGEVRPL